MPARPGSSLRSSDQLDPLDHKLSDIDHQAALASDAL